MIAVRDLEKGFGSVAALGGITFDVRQAELFGLIGADGAGKTTLLRILATLLLPDAGSAAIDGLDVERDYRTLRRHLGYMPGRFSLYPDLTVEENLRFFASVFGTTVEENFEIIAPIYRQIEPFRMRRAGALSGGMKQKLALSCALVHRPRVLLLDEPTTGVDAVSRREFWEMLANLKSRGLTILVSTPYMDEAARCDRIALIHRGHLLGIDRPEDLPQRFDRPLFAIRASHKYEALLALRERSEAHSAHSFGDVLHYADRRDDVDPLEIMRYLEDRGLSDVSVESTRPGIEDVFMELAEREVSAWP